MERPLDSDTYEININLEDISMVHLVDIKDVLEDIVKQIKCSFCKNNIAESHKNLKIFYCNQCPESMNEYATEPIEEKIQEMVEQSENIKTKFVKTLYALQISGKHCKQEVLDKRIEDFGKYKSAYTKVVEKYINTAK